MLALRSDPPADATTADELARIRDEILTLSEGTVGMYAPALLRDADEVIARQGARALIVETEPVDEQLDATLLAVGFDCTREMLQLRRTLPVTSADDQSADNHQENTEITIAPRAFRPGEDELAWLAVNNRAFDWHPEQGGWTLEDILVREGEPWFDPEGFLLLEDDTPGSDPALVGFCWTKIHPPSGDDPALGEIYVIASDPAAQGRGLGRQLTLAGLQWLADQGISTGMLYVEADNGAARHVYEDVLGFHIHLAHRWYERALADLT